IPAAEVLQACGVIMISTSSTNPATTQIGDRIFRMAYTDDFQGRVAARYAFDDLGARSAIVFRQQDDDYSFGLAGFFNEQFLALGGSSVVVDFVANTVDFSAQISDILGEPADVIYFSGFCAEGATLVPALRAAGLAQQILGADASDDSQCPVGGGEAFNGYIFTGFDGAEVLSGEAAARATDFANFFRVQNPNATDFDGFTLAGADSMNVIAEAVRVAGTSDAAAVLAALQGLDGYAGVSGDITFAGTDGTPKDRTIGFFQYLVPAPDGSAWGSVAQFGLGTGE
ncbi:MAG: ABC transporter substrate-binding protein, partial [bacterium]|nr:ABC transporter substrate-binding protein [bacterium]